MLVISTHKLFVAFASNRYTWSVITQLCFTKRKQHSSLKLQNDFSENIYREFTPCSPFYENGHHSQTVNTKHYNTTSARTTISTGQKTLNIQNKNTTYYRIKNSRCRLLVLTETGNRRLFECWLFYGMPILPRWRKPDMNILVHILKDSSIV